jgi:hypothetical protein
LAYSRDWIALCISLISQSQTRPGKIAKLEEIDLPVPAMPKESSAPSALRFQWQHTIEAALREPDPNKRREKVYDAEAAIFSSLQELAQNWEGTQHQEERQAITDACKMLWILKQDALGFPDWE